MVIAVVIAQKAIKISEHISLDKNSTIEWIISGSTVLEQENH